MHHYDAADGIYPIDGSRSDLAAEFKAKVRGPHSDELRRVLHRMRAGSLAGKYVLVVEEPFRRWSLARLTGERGRAAETIKGQVFESLDDAEWAVFKLRWRDLTGVELDF